MHPVKIKLFYEKLISSHDSYDYRQPACWKCIFSSPLATFLVNSRSKHWSPIRCGWWQFYKFMQMFFRSGVYLFCKPILVYVYNIYVFLSLVIYCCANGNSSLRFFILFVSGMCTGLIRMVVGDCEDCEDCDNGCGHIHTYICIP